MIPQIPYWLIKQNLEVTFFLKCWTSAAVAELWIHCHFFSSKQIQDKRLWISLPAILNSRVKPSQNALYMSVLWWSINPRNLKVARGSWDLDIYVLKIASTALRFSWEITIETSSQVAESGWEGGHGSARSLQERKNNANVNLFAVKTL